MMEKVKGIYKRLTKIGCTGCAYCMPCPFGVNIPGCFASYNEYSMLPGRWMTRIMYGARMLGVMGKPANASLCKNCGKCEMACPQHIDIPNQLKKVSYTLDGLRTRALIPLFKLMFSDKVSDD
jgi:hypothetical protein